MSYMMTIDKYKFDLKAAAKLRLYVSDIVLLDYIAGVLDSGEKLDLEFQNLVEAFPVEFKDTKAVAKSLRRLRRAKLLVRCKYNGQKALGLVRSKFDEIAEGV
jgi:predicted nucleic acid-binding protein